MILDNTAILCNVPISIPEYKTWIVTIYHIARAGLTEWTGENCQLMKQMPYYGF